MVGRRSLLVGHEWRNADRCVHVKRGEIVLENVEKEEGLQLDRGGKH